MIYTKAIIAEGTIESEWKFMKGYTTAGVLFHELFLFPVTVKALNSYEPRKERQW